MIPEFDSDVRKWRDNARINLYTVGMKSNTVVNRTLDKDACYQALLTHDARFDGVFFVGVATTGIYCRTVCPARTPRRENCAFYPSAAAAERAGFRPCLRCRPERAPGNAGVDATSRLAARIAGRIEDGALTEGSVEDLAVETGISSRHLRRVIETEFGVSPIALAQTQRLLLAKRLLTDTTLAVSAVAAASGFSSLRRFNALFKERYRLNPTELRQGRREDKEIGRQGDKELETQRTGDREQETEREDSSLIPGVHPQGRTHPSSLMCELAYRPPLDWQSLLAFLVGRSSSGVETVDEGRYLRVVGIGEHRGWIAVDPVPDKPALRVELSASLAPVILPTLARVKRLFDLEASPQYIAGHLGELAQARPGLRVPGAFDGFEMAARAILGQQISVRAATTISGRFAAAFGEPVTTPFARLTHLPPTAERVARADAAELIALGIITTRANSILALARMAAEGKLSLTPGVDIEPTLIQLKAIPGIGDWTAQYIAMRALAWPDAFPHTDLGIYKALGETNPKRVLALSEAWRPWRAYAAMHLWKSLEEPV